METCMGARAGRRLGVEADDEERRVHHGEHSAVPAVLLEHAAVRRPRVAILHCEAADADRAVGNGRNRVDQVLDLPLERLWPQPPPTRSRDTLSVRSSPSLAVVT